MGGSLSSLDLHDLAPVRPDERSELFLGRRVNHKQYKRHLAGEFSEACIFEVPWAVRDSISLYEKLDLSFNRIADIPVELPMRLPHLSCLNISFNQLTYLPESFGFLFHLKSATLCHNNLKQLPQSFIHLVKLKKIDLSHNLLKELPENMGEMESIEKINVSNNKLKVLPASLGSSHTLKVILADHNRLLKPPQATCNEGSQQTLEYLRRNAPDGYIEPVKRTINVFQRVRGNQLQFTSPNPQSQISEYIQSQTSTAHVASRVKSPLLPPADASTLDVLELKDRIIGMIYGAAVGEALGLATSYLSPDKCQFHYDSNSLQYSDIIRDEWRTHWRPGDWATNFDQMMLVLDSVVQWAGVIDELDFAKRLHEWSANGFKELGDAEGFVVCNTTSKVVNDEHFLKGPHQVAKWLLEKTGVVEEEDELHNLYADNGAICSSLILGAAHFHDLREVSGNAVRVCKTTHSDPQCVAGAVMSTVLVAFMLQGTYNLTDSSDVENMIAKAEELALSELTLKPHIDALHKYTMCSSVESAFTREEGSVEFVFKPLGCALSALRSQADFRTGLLEVIMSGGAAHTNACLTGAILGCKTGFSKIPHDLLEGLRRRQVEWLNGKINLLLDIMGFP